MAGQEFAEYYIAHKLFDFAIFSTSDFIAIGMMMTFRKHHLQPGRDFKLISYDNFEGRLNRQDFQFGITSITHPQDVMVKALIAMLNNQNTHDKEVEFYQTYFVPATIFTIRDTANLKQGN